MSRRSHLEAGDAHVVANVRRRDLPRPFRVRAHRGAGRARAVPGAARVRAASYDERLAPLPGTTTLAVNGAPVPRGLASGEIARFVFDAWRGADYTIRIRVDRGAVETFASLIPSVG